MMIPSTTTRLVGQNATVIPARDRPSRTYRIDFVSGRVTGLADGREAMEQAIAKAILTERFAHLIYSWNYGAELNPVFGKPFAVMESEVRRAIREAVLADSRVAAVNDIVITQADKRAVAVCFTAVTKFGDIPIEQEVAVHGI